MGQNRVSFAQLEILSHRCELFLGTFKVHRTFLLDKKLKESLRAGQNHQTPNLDWIR